MVEVVKTKGVLGEDPRIEGTRISVLQVYELVVEGDNPPSEIADQLELSLAEIHKALAYYYENPDEMREIKKQHKKAIENLKEKSLKPPEKKV